MAIFNRRSTHEPRRDLGNQANDRVPLIIAAPGWVADFDRLHSRRHDGDVQLLGFDPLEFDGDDLRQELLERRKVRLAKLLRRSHGSIHLIEQIEAVYGGAGVAQGQVSGESGDVLVVTKLDRLAHSMLDLLRLIEQMAAQPAGTARAQCGRRE